MRCDRDDIARIGTVRIVASEGVRWPLVHRHDIGTLCALALEAGAPANSYTESTIDCVPVGVIARAAVRHCL